MWLKFGSFILMLFVVSPYLILADNHAPGNEVQEAPSRFLSAEAQRLIKNEFKDIDQNLRNYQDENFLAMDMEIKNHITETQQKIVIGTLGAVFLAGSIVAMFMFHLARKYSYEKYLEGELKREKETYAHVDPNLQEFQQQEWPQPSQDTISTDQGQVFASNSSVFSQHQVSPARPGGWEWQGDNNEFK